MRNPPSHHISSFPSFPTFSQWKEKSMVGNRFSGPFRRNDPALTRIDELVKAFNSAKTVGEGQFLLGEIFFSTMWWNNNYKRDPKMHEDRREAIMSLNLTAANILGSALGCGIGGIASELRNIYGKSLSAYGASVDQGKEDSYLTAARREAFRAVFKGGKAWRFNCLEYKQKQNIQTPLKLIDTKEYAKLMTDANSAMDERIEGEGKAGYIMSMSREFYVGPFVANKGFKGPIQMPKFHSFFMAGGPVQCGGIIRVKGGIVDYIDNESGHYKPIDLALVKALEHLKTIGMNLKKIKVGGISIRDRLDNLPRPRRKEDVNLVTEGVQIDTWGDKFLAVNGNWEAIYAGSMD
jgi:hypothetical protein